MRANIISIPESAAFLSWYLECCLSCRDFFFNSISEGLVIGAAFGAIIDGSKQPNSTSDDPFTSARFIYQFMFFVLFVYLT